MKPMKRIAAVAQMALSFRRSLCGGLRLALIAWHIVRGAYLVGVRFPGLRLEPRQLHIQRWSSAVLRSLGVTVQFRGRLHGGGQMLVANHVSWLDVIVLLALCPQARFVSKAEVQHWPLIGRLAAGARTIFVERDRPRQTFAAVDALAAALSAGETVIVFPEGTTTAGHAVLPFRATLLQAALLASAPVRPVALRYAEAGHDVSPSTPYIGDDTLLGSLWRTARAPGLVANVRVLPADGHAMSDRRSLATALHAAISAELEPPASSAAPGARAPQPEAHEHLPGASSPGAA